MATSLISILLVILSSIIGAFGGFVFKGAAKELKFNLKKMMRNYRLIFGFILFGLASVIYIGALTKGELNVLYPVSSLTYIWSSLIAKKYLNEKLNFYKWSGIALIILGAILIVH